MIETKVQAMRGKLLKPADYAALIDSQEGFIKQLATYEGYLFLQTEHTTLKNRTIIEEKLRTTLEVDTDKLMRFMPAKMKKAYATGATKRTSMAKIQQKKRTLLAHLESYNRDKANQTTYAQQIKQQYQLSPLELEQNKEQLLMGLYKKQAIQKRGIYQVWYYLFLKEIEIKNLITILEASYYKEPKDSIQQRLIYYDRKNVVHTAGDT